MSDFFTRRDFLSGLSASAMAAVYPPEFVSFLESRSQNTKPLPLIKPPALKQGAVR